MADDFEARVQRAREANLALYLDDPSLESARLLIVFERAVATLRDARAQAEAVSRGMDFLRKVAGGAPEGQGSDAP